MKVEAPNGAVLEACPEAAERLLAAGFKPVKAEKKGEPEEKPRARKTRKRD